MHKLTQAKHVSSCVYVSSGDAGYLHFAVTGRLPAAGVQDSAAHVPGAAAHRQVPPLHVHHEHRLHPSYCSHHQLEL